MHVANWSASRSGAAMTVRGTAEVDGSRIKLANVAKIEARGRLVVAIQADGEEHILRLLG
jgi:hypothetical protein